MVNPNVSFVKKHMTSYDISIVKNLAAKQFEWDFHHGFFGEFDKT